VAEGLIVPAAATQQRSEQAIAALGRVSAALGYAAF